MALFGKKKTPAPCCESCNDHLQIREKEAAQGSGAVKVLGSGCAKCRSLEDAAKAALAELGWSDTIDHVSDFAAIAAYGVMTTPALVVDGKVLSSGKVLSKQEIMNLLLKVRASQA